MDRYVPTESEEQCLLFEWAELSLAKYPELALLFHDPNVISKSKFQAVKFKREGLIAGVPDLCLPVARQGYHGLYYNGMKVAENMLGALYFGTVDSGNIHFELLQ